MTTWLQSAWNTPPCSGACDPVKGWRRSFADDPIGADSGGGMARVKAAKRRACEGSLDARHRSRRMADRSVGGRAHSGEADLGRSVGLMAGRWGELPFCCSLEPFVSLH